LLTNSLVKKTESHHESSHHKPYDVEAAT
jgi:hypothetical protein